MPWAIVNDLEYLTTRLHGRRSRMAEGERLEALCHLSSLPELAQAIYPQAEFHLAADLQRRLTQDLVQELANFLKHLDGPGAALLCWLITRFQVENIKVLLRRFLSAMRPAPAETHLLTLPHGWTLDVPALTAAESLETFIAGLPRGAPRQTLRQVLGLYHEHPRPFFLEAALDRGYFQELLARTEPIASEEQELIRPLVEQEVDAFHLALAARGKFQYGLKAELLSTLHVAGSGIRRERFSAMLTAPDLAAAASLAVGRAIDRLPVGSGESGGTVDAPRLEALTWQRFLRLSNRAFRRSQLGLGVVVGYSGLRRVEVANLITLSEGLADGTAAADLRAHLIPRPELEPVYV